ncbi:MAG: hypothetical protein WC651_00570 [Candidatus Gracilibacteria bacterium]|jgi:hypothetical protein
MKNQKNEYFILLNNKKYLYTLRKMAKNRFFVECKDANIAQEFLSEDIPDLLIDLPNLILAEREYNQGQADVVRFRLSVEDKKTILKKAYKKGYKTVSGFLRDLALGA